MEQMFVLLENLSKLEHYVLLEIITFFQSTPRSCGPSLESILQPETRCWISTILVLLPERAGISRLPKEKGREQFALYKKKL
jgi:hypothetical protein